MKSNLVTKKIIYSISFDSLNTNFYSAYVKPNIEYKDIISLSVEGELLNDIERYINKKNRAEIEFYNFFLNNIPPTESMNPFYNYPPDYFVKKISDKPLQHIKELNELLLKKGNKKIFLLDTIIKKYSRGIVHIGEKGSGKTISQNFWLHKNNSKLENNKVFWVRLDFAKLRDIWKRNKNLLEKDYITTEDYFLGQIAYVFSKHFNKSYPLYSPLIGKIVEEISKSTDNNLFFSEINISKKRLYNYDVIEIAEKLCNDRKINSVTSALEYFEERIAKYEGYFKGEDRKSKEKRSRGKKSYLIDAVLNNSQETGKGSKILWCLIGQKIREYLNDNNYFILYVLDGMDNINYYANDKEQFIDRAYKQIKEFPLKEERIYDNEIVLLSIRDTTFKDLQKKLRNDEYIDHKKFRCLKSFYHIYQDTNNVQKKILNNRIKFILKKTRGNKSKMKEVISEMLNYNQIIDEKRWYANTRTYIHNHLSLAKLITFRYYFAGKPSNFNIKSQIDTFENINMLLNGQLYIDEENMIPRSNTGFNFFNVFGYHNQKNKPKYFIYIRILQLIDKHSEISKAELYKYLFSFSYQDKDINYCIDRMNRRGMIKIDYNGGKVETLKMLITPKGKYALNIFVSDIHFLYYTSMDTLLPLDLVSSLIYVPYNFTKSENSKRHYPSHSIVTGIKFLQYLIIENNKQIKIASKKNSNIIADDFKLHIDLEALSNSIEKMVNVIIKDNDTKQKQLLNEHFELIEYVW